MTTTMNQKSDWLTRVKRDLIEKYDISDAGSVGVKSMDATFKADGDGDRFTAIISNATMDTDREVLLPSGMISTRFEKSGPGYYMHDYSTPPIFVPTGKVGYDGGNLTSGARWLNSQLAKDVREFVEVMADEGKAAGVSIGAFYRETRKPTKKDKEMFGPDVVSVVSKWELLEWSIAPIQANPDAVVTRLGKSRCKSLFPGWNPEPTVSIDAKAVSRLLTQQRELKAAGDAILAGITARRKAAQEAEQAKALLAVKIREGRKRGLVYV